DHVDPPTGGLGDVGMREVHALREPTAHPGALPPRYRVDLDLGPTVARVTPGNDIVAPQVLAVGDHDRGGRAVVDHPAVDLDPEVGRGGEPPGPVRRGTDHDHVHREQLTIVGRDPQRVDAQLQRGVVA